MEQLNELRIRFLDFIGKYKKDGIEDAWEEIKNAYSDKGRHYHNLEHLSNIFRVITELAPELSDDEELNFAVWYHDFIYDVAKKDNEYASAVYAEKVMNDIGVEKERIDQVKRMINYTANHSVHLLDERYVDQIFLDADLAILGMDSETYQKYTLSIRKEYSIYPDILYNQGRKSVLKKLLSTEIYRTEKFKNRFEEKAKQNMKEELKQLEGKWF